MKHAHFLQLVGLSALSVAVPFLLYAWAALRLPADYLALLNTTAVLGFAGVALIVGLGPVDTGVPQLWAMLACLVAAMAMLGVLSSGLATWMHLRIMRHVSSVATVSPVFLIPLFGVTWGHLFLDEAVGAGLLVGALLALAASALIADFNPL